MPRVPTRAVFHAGCADFVPACRDVGSQFAPSEFESFGEVVFKASCWLNRQQHLRVTNVQSIDYKLLHGSGRRCHQRPGDRSFKYNYNTGWAISGCCTTRRDGVCSTSYALASDTASSNTKHGNIHNTFFVNCFYYSLADVLYNIIKIMYLIQKSTLVTDRFME